MLELVPALGTEVIAKRFGWKHVGTEARMAVLEAIAVLVFQRIDIIAA
jgi:hypothetical protein